MLRFRFRYIPNRDARWGAFASESFNNRGIASTGISLSISHLIRLIYPIEQFWDYMKDWIRDRYLAAYDRKLSYDQLREVVRAVWDAILLPS